MENIGNPTINYGAVIDSPNIVCECGCKTFAPAAILKKVSKIVTMTVLDGLNMLKIGIRNTNVERLLASIQKVMTNK